MRIERRHVSRESTAELAEKKAAALEEGRRRFPNAIVSIAAYYGGEFYLEIRHEAEPVAEVVRV